MVGPQEGGEQRQEGASSNGERQEGTVGDAWICDCEDESELATRESHSHGGSGTRGPGGLGGVAAVRKGYEGDLLP